MSSVSNVSFQSTAAIQTKPEKKVDDKKSGSMSTGTKVVLGTALAALAATGIYLVTKNSKTSKNVLETLKSNETYKGIEPTVTKLKNGRTKVEFRLNDQERDLYIIDSKNNISNFICFNKYGYNSSVPNADGSYKTVKRMFSIEPVPQKTVETFGQQKNLTTGQITWAPVKKTTITRGANGRSVHTIESPVEGRKEAEHFTTISHIKEGENNIQFIGKGKRSFVYDESGKCAVRPDYERTGSIKLNGKDVELSNLTKEQLYKLKQDVVDLDLFFPKKA